MTVIAHLSDLHIGAGDHTAARLDRVLRHLVAMPAPPDVVIVTGDIADHGEASEYEQVRRLLALPVPVLFCPGNHDAREPFRRVLLSETPLDEAPLDEPATPGPVNRAHSIAGVLFALCDSTIPGRGDGLLADGTLAWLDTVLGESGPAPAFVCFHHPPVDLGQPDVDRIRQFGEQRLVEVLSRHPSVVAMLCGHAHTPAASRLAGVPVLVAPGVASSLMLAGEAHQPAPALSPGLAFHILHDDHRLTTHYRTVT